MGCECRISAFASFSIEGVISIAWGAGAKGGWWACWLEAVVVSGATPAIDMSNLATKERRLWRSASLPPVLEGV